MKRYISAFFVLLITSCFALLEARGYARGRRYQRNRTTYCRHNSVNRRYARRNSPYRFSQTRYQRKNTPNVATQPTINQQNMQQRSAPEARKAAPLTCRTVAMHRVLSGRRNNIKNTM